MRPSYCLTIGSRVLLEAQVKDILKTNWSGVRSAHTKYGGLPKSKLPLEHVLTLADKLGADTISKLMLVGFENIRERIANYVLVKRCLEEMSFFLCFAQLLIEEPQWRAGGLPDLILWAESEGMTPSVFMTEVKGPNDRLSCRQIAWLRQLCSLGIDARVSFVKYPEDI